MLWEAWVQHGRCEVWRAALARKEWLNLALREMANTARREAASRRRRPGLPLGRLRVLRYFTP